MTPWWPWCFPGEADRIIDLIRRSGIDYMPVDRPPWPRFVFFRFLGSRMRHRG